MLFVGLAEARVQSATSKLLEHSEFFALFVGLAEMRGFWGMDVVWGGCGGDGLGILRKGVSAYRASG